MRRLVFLSLILLGACKQGEGEYCQVNSDCKDGLVCKNQTMTCGPDVAGGDAGSEPDARPPDAQPIDASLIDAPIDAEPIDADLTP